MKTNTGLTIVHKGARVNVYTAKELEILKQENKLISAIKTLLGIEHQTIKQ